MMKSIVSYLEHKTLQMNCCYYYSISRLLLPSVCSPLLPVKLKLTQVLMLVPTMATMDMAMLSVDTMDMDMVMDIMDMDMV